MLSIEFHCLKLTTNKQGLYCDKVILNWHSQKIWSIGPWHKDWTVSRLSPISLPPPPTAGFSPMDDSHHGLFCYSALNFSQMQQNCQNRALGQIVRATQFANVEIAWKFKAKAKVIIERGLTAFCGNGLPGIRKTLRRSTWKLKKAYSTKFTWPDIFNSQHTIEVFVVWGWSVADATSSESHFQAKWCSVLLGHHFVGLLL